MEEEPAFHGDMGYEQKIFKLFWRCHYFLPGFLVISHLPRVPHQSRLSANGGVAMKRNGEVCPDVLAFTLRLRRLGDRLMKAVRPVIA
jgi:hypothetical protein